VAALGRARYARAREPERLPLAAGESVTGESEAREVLPAAGIAMAIAIAR
jgi:hypothetical protein